VSFYTGVTSLKIRQLHGTRNLISVFTTAC